MIYNDRETWDKCQDDMRILAMADVESSCHLVNSHGQEITG